LVEKNEINHQETSRRRRERGTAERTDQGASSSKQKNKKRKEVTRPRGAHPQPKNFRAKRGNAGGEIGFWEQKPNDSVEEHRHANIEKKRPRRKEMTSEKRTAHSLLKARDLHPRKGGRHIGGKKGREVRPTPGTV